jgi:hypothetical protein
MSLLASPPVRRHCRDTYSEYARVGCSVMATVTRSRSPCTRRYARSPHLLTSALRWMTSSRDAWGETRRKFRRTANLLRSRSCTILSGYGTVGKAVNVSIAQHRVDEDTVRGYDTQAEVERIVPYAPHSVNSPISLPPSTTHWRDYIERIFAVAGLSQRRYTGAHSHAAACSLSHRRAMLRAAR